MDLGLDGRRALVTGASSGIAKGIALALAAEGARVAITSRSRERIDAAAAEIGATGLVWDSDDLDAVPDLLAAVQAALGGPLDVLVSSTGGPPAGGDPLAFTREQWEAAHRSLVLAPMALVTAVSPGMRERRWGRILNVASTSVREPLSHLMLSNAERSATLAAFKTLSREIAADGVTVNSVLPGRIMTERLVSMSGSEEAVRAAAERQVPARRVGRVDEIAQVAAFLCSEQAAYVTGVALPVDGGLLHGI
ncbi:MAG: family oxidoreductase [Solirubrobacterales bacterium]|nr:family oxidoreductase [Solirubrobacterales bacterium]